MNTPFCNRKSKMMDGVKRATFLSVPLLCLAAVACVGRADEKYSVDRNEMTGFSKFVLKIERFADGMSVNDFIQESEIESRKWHSKTAGTQMRYWIKFRSGKWVYAEFRKDGDSFGLSKIELLFREAAQDDK